MPIHINLLAEAQAAEELRRRDPVKRAIFIAISLVAVFLVWSAAVAALQMEANASYTGVQTGIDARTNAYSHVMVDKRKLDLDMARLNALKKFQAARFLQGNLLNALQEATVDGVQLTGLHLEQTYFLAEGTENQTNDDRIILGRPSTVKERITLHLDARDFSANPGDQINKFVATIAKEPYFAAMLDKTNAIELTSPPSSPMSDNGKTYVTFSLECHFPEQTR